MKLGIALSGGGIKSYAQLPILKTFEDMGVEFDYISGTSMGAAIAALMAVGKTSDEMTQLALSIEEKLVKTRLFMKPSLKVLPFSKDKIYGGYVDGVVIEDIFNEVVGDLLITDVTIPLAIPAVDIKSGKVVVFVSHPHLFKGDPDWVVVSDISLAKAVRASCSFPMVIGAMELDDMLLVDGGVKMNLPSQLINSYGAHKVAGITMTSEGDFEEYDSLIALGNRIYDMMIESYDRLLEDQIDLLINVPIGHIYVFEFGKGKDVIIEGFKQSSKYLSQIEAFKEQSLLDKIIKR